LPDKNERIKSAIETYVVPHVAAWDSHALAQAKLGIQYMLSFTPESCEQLFLGRMHHSMLLNLLGWPTNGFGKASFRAKTGNSRTLMISRSSFKPTSNDDV
jgi:hypothetical protein